MEKLEIEDIAKKVIEGSMSEQEGAKKLMELIFLYKRLFGLASLDEDQFTEFLLFQYDKLLRIFSNYNPAYGQFFTFLQGSIRGTYLTWRKQAARDKTALDTITISPSMTFEESMSHYALPGDSYSMNHVHSKGHSVHHSTYQPLSLRRNDGKLSCRYKNPSVQRRRINNLRKDASLILTLKSSFYINEDIVEKVSYVSGVPAEKINDMCDKVKSSLKNKIDRRSACVRCRDNAFFFHRKYMLEYRRIDRQTIWSEIIHSKYKKQTKTWNEKNSRLQRKDYRITASNRLVGKILGITPRRVTYVIRQAQQNMDIIQVK